MSFQEELPSIGLRMKCTPFWRPHCPQEQDLSGDRVKVMLRQDGETYQCRDYLRRPQQVGGSEECPSSENEEELDAVCREKMLDWGFRVCDHFHINREIVAVSTSILDRFVGKCTCDRTAFKLAAMTSLYLATKVFDQKQIMVNKLVELSRGEFSEANVLDMESIILQTLKWRVNPTTAQSFIQSFFDLVPVSNDVVSRAIYDRAVFFAEVCLFDYSFVTESRAVIAAASILNAMEGIDDCYIPQESHTEFLFRLRGYTHAPFPLGQVERIRERLWYVYSLTAQYRDDDLQMMPTLSIRDVPQKHYISEHGDQLSRSPVSVTGSKS